MISVLLPTIRPHLIMQSFNSIAPAADGIAYEVVVIADFGPDVLGCNAPYAHLRCSWVTCERRGVVDALNIGYSVAEGDFIFSFNDESVLEKGALRMMHHAARAMPDRLLTPRHLPEFNFSYYGKSFAPFPFAHRQVITELGGIADPAYRSFYADPDLSMRAHAKGIAVQVVDGAVIHHNNAHDLVHQQSVVKYFDSDQRVFRSRWDHLGEFRDP